MCIASIQQQIKILNRIYNLHKYKLLEKQNIYYIIYGL